MGNTFSGRILTWSAVTLSMLGASVVFSYLTAIFQMKKAVAPAIADGWYHFGTELNYRPLFRVIPSWELGFYHDSLQADPPASYIPVSVFGEIGDWYVTELLNRNCEMQSARGAAN